MTIDTSEVVTRADWVLGPPQGQWTYHHYAALPDDGQRYEIIEGVLYMAPSPTGPHQDVVLEIASYLRTYIKLTGLGLVRIAPFDVELAPGTVFQPDVLVVLKTNSATMTDNRMIGAPDLAVEVASRSTALLDRREKFDAYARAKVPEYWIADPGSRSVELLVLEGTTYTSLGSFAGNATLPSKIIPDMVKIPVSWFFA